MSDTTTKNKTSKPRKSNDDVYQEITDKILTLLDAGTVPWHKPWNSAGFPVSLSSGKPYRGINVFLLGLDALDKGFTSPYWGTFKQLRERNGQVRRGEHGSGVILWKPIYVDKGETDDHGKPKKSKIFLIRTYTVFNVEQCDAIDPTKPIRVPKSNLVEHEPIEAAHEVLHGYFGREGSPKLDHGGNSAYYNPRSDEVRLPVLGSFHSAEEYYSTAFHEATHSTGHPTRKNRPGITELGVNHRFGDPAYCKEELVAEMGAAMLSGYTGIDHVTVKNSASYIDHWRAKLGEDKRIVVQAAAQAQHAVDHILGTTFDKEVAEDG